MMKIPSILIFLLFLIPGISQAGEHYHWIDKDGVQCFSNYLKPPQQRGNFTFGGSLPETQTTPLTKTEKKEDEIREILKKIEDRNDKVEAIKETYFQPGADKLKNIMQLILPASPENEP